ncbi:MAG: GIY-YIG nuclease family protein [Nanoarchaeota archaeon]
MWVYLITNILNGLIYIGRTVNSIRCRWHGHIYDMERGSRSQLYKAMREHGIENFIIQPLEQIDNLPELKRKEIEWMFKLQSNNPKIGYNSQVYTESKNAQLNNHNARFTSLKRGKFVGVWYVKENKTYRAALKFNTDTYVKNYKTVEEAVESYDKMCLYFYGKEAKINFEDRRQQYLQLDLESFIKGIKIREKTSKYLGVHNAPKDKWLSEIRINYKTYCIGQYSNEVDAAKAYDKVAYYIKPEIARLNFPEEIKYYSHSDLKIAYEEMIKPLKWRSKFRGVTFHHKAWESRITHNKQIIFLGYFHDEVTAARAYDHKVKELNLNRKLNFEYV